MDDSKLTLLFRGVADLKPSTLKARELGELIAAFESAVVAVVRAHDSDIQADQIMVPLVSVEDGSIGLEFRPNLPEYTYRAASEIVEAFVHNAFQVLPISALQSLKTITRFVRRHGCEAVIGVKVKGQTKVSGVITPSTRIETMFRIEGETDLYGQVMRVGGVEPRVELKTIQGDTLYCDTTEQIAVQMGEILYQEVSVHGVATWDFDTLKIRDFEIQSFSPTKDTPLTETFRAFHESVGTYLDDIEDVEGWVTAIREGEETWHGDSLR